MDEVLARERPRPHDVVVEITERVAIVRHDEFQGALRTFKERGYRVAVDDMGAGYASLQSLASIEPDFLKFDTSLVRDIDKSSIKQSLLESLRQLGGQDPRPRHRRRDRARRGAADPEEAGHRAGPGIPLPPAREW